jgi:hypothetical protein
VVEKSAISQMDEFGRHEVLHMSHFLACAIERELLDHEQIKARAEWKALAESACTALGKLYQAIGQESYDAKEAEGAAYKMPPITPSPTKRQPARPPGQSGRGPPVQR